jgi:hypothetical protein
MRKADRAEEDWRKSMAKWTVRYHIPDEKRTYETVVEVRDDVTTAVEVQKLIEEGKLADLHITRGLVYLVQRYEAPGIA